MYGEVIYGVHPLEYDPVPQSAAFRLFAARENGTWISWYAVSALTLICPPFPRCTGELRRRSGNCAAPPKP